MSVEYAIEAISHAGAAVGIRTTKGVILAAEKKILSKVLVSLSLASLWVIGSQIFWPAFGDGHGFWEDVQIGWPRRCRRCRYKFRRESFDQCREVRNPWWAVYLQLIKNSNRLFAQRYAASYSEPVPVEQLVHHLCDQKQGYTQFGGLRPFGVSFLYAGWFVFYILFPLNFPKSRILGIKALAFNFIKAIPPATMPAGRQGHNFHRVCMVL